MKVLQRVRSRASGRRVGRALSAVIAAFTMTAISNVEAQDVTLRFANVMAPSHDTSIAAEKFSELVAKKTGGGTKITIFPGGQLGSDKATYELVQQNLLELAAGGNTNLVTINPAFEVFNLPYLFENREQAIRAMESPAVRSKINADLARSNLHWVLGFEYGFRAVLTTKREVSDIASMKGLRFRTSRSPVEIAGVEAFGARAVTIDWPEVYQALQHGVADGLGVNLATAVSARHHELLKYALVNDWQFFFFTTVISLDKWKKLPAATQTSIAEAAREAEVYHRTLWVDADQRARKAMAEKGIKVTDLNEAQKKPWIQAGRSIWAKAGIPQATTDLILREAKAK